jgi:hypothetical protein
MTPKPKQQTDTDPTLPTHQKKDASEVRLQSNTIKKDRTYQLKDITAAKIQKYCRNHNYVLIYVFGLLTF